MTKCVKDLIEIDIPALVARIRELEAELQVRDNMGNEVLRILREATGKRDFHSEMEAAEWAARMLAETLEKTDKLVLEAQHGEKRAVDTVVDLRRELADARLDSARLDWVESQCVFQMTVPQFWRNRNGKISFAPFDEAKLVEADSVRAAIDAAMEVLQ